MTFFLEKILGHKSLVVESSTNLFLKVRMPSLTYPSSAPRCAARVLRPQPHIYEQPRKARWVPPSNLMSFPHQVFSVKAAFFILFSPSCLASELSRPPPPYPALTAVDAIVRSTQ